MSEYLAPESRWRSVAANLKLGSNGFRFQVCCFHKRLRTYSASIRILKGSRIFFSELNIELIIDAKLARLLGCELGLLNIRRTLAPLPT